MVGFHINNASNLVTLAVVVFNNGRRRCNGSVTVNGVLTAINGHTEPLTVTVRQRPVTVNGAVIHGAVATAHNSARQQPRKPTQSTWMLL
ncbi:MAG: hypothetical protein Aurels2KO_57620 [Aureliella sp.]